jgi:hypothetical protein
VTGLPLASGRQRARVARLALCALLAWLGAAAAAWAHDVADRWQLHAFARTEGSRLQVVVRMPLELLLNVDLPKRGNGYLDLERAGEAFPRALQATANGLRFQAEGKPLELLRGDARIALPSDRSFGSFDEALAAVRGPRLPAGTDVYWNQGWFDAALEYALPSPAAAVELDFAVAPGLGERLRLDLRYVTADGATRAFELATGRGPVALDPGPWRAAATFVRSGFVHILLGPDHLLFLLCLMVPFRRLGWPLVGVVTAFTLGHSVTLVAAALGLVPAGEWFAPLVELLIAASILGLAIENVLGARLQRRWLVSGLFGLVHGFGFSFALAGELQFAGAHLLTSLLAFNVGIELGQLLALALAWPLLAWFLRRAGRSERAAVAVLSLFVGHAAWHWMVERWEATVAADWSSFDPAAAVVAALLAAAAAMVARALWRRPGPPAAARPPATP